MSAPRECIVGIDLGTTFSLVAYADERGPQVIRDERGEARLPSVISLRPAPDGLSIDIGWQARAHAVEHADSTVYSVKRLIGKGFDEIRSELPFLTYRVERGPRQTLQILIGEQRYTPESLSALILSALRERAERHLGQPVRKAVITVPAYFDDAQRQATRDAGQAAGLEVVRIINEPTAAALAYGIGLRSAPRATTFASRASDDHARALPLPSCHDPNPSDSIAEAPRSARPNIDRCVAIYDLGGGTFDVSVLRLESDVFQVLSTAGDTHLGGDDFDRALITLVSDDVRRQFGLEIESPAARQALRGLAEAVKIRLSDQPQAELELELGGARTYRRTITRAEFEAAVTPLVERTIELLLRAIRDAGLTLADLDQVVLVGGSTRIPLVRRLVERAFGRAPYTALNPDEVVALGAAVQAGLLAGVSREMLLLDVIPLSLGIETMGGAMGKLIVRNTTIPCRTTEMFTTFVDGQTAIKLNVLQGERELAADCRRLGEFTLRDIPPMPAGLPKIEVEFLVDANGILTVSAQELRSGRRAAIQVAPNYGLTREEVAQMARESIAHAQADLYAHRRVDLRNQVAFDTHKAEQMLAQVGDQLDPDEAQRVRQSIASLRALSDSAENLDELHQALNEFGRSTLHLAEIGIRAALRSAPQAR